MQYTVSAYINVDPNALGMVHGYGPRHPIALVDSFTVKAGDVFHAAHEMFSIGNRMGCDLLGKTWPNDVRSLSVGDLVKVTTPACNEHPSGAITFLACARVGWTGVPEPANPIVPLEGCEMHTSRIQLEA